MIAQVVMETVHAQGNLFQGHGNGEVTALVLPTTDDNGTPYTDNPQESPNLRSSGSPPRTSKKEVLSLPLTGFR